MKKTLVSFVIIVSLLPHFALAIESLNITGRTSFGYDNNVFEKTESKTGQSFWRLYLDSKLPLLRSERLKGVLRLQDGFKTVGVRENVAINQVNLQFALRISPQLTSEVLSELKHKSVSVYQKSSAPSEYGYLNWHSGVSLRFNLRNVSSNFRYIRSRRDYADSDLFDSKIRQIEFLTNIGFSRKLTASFIVEGQRFHFPQSPIYERKPEINQPTQQEAAPKVRYDNLYGCGVGLQWVGKILINPNYVFQRNKSNSVEYSFHAHQFSILTASTLCYDIIMQLYGRLQLRKYHSQETPPLLPADEDNTELARNVLIFSLTKDIFKNCSLEARYLLSQSDIPSSSIRYTKQSYSFTVSYQRNLKIDGSIVSDF